MHLKHQKKKKQAVLNVLKIDWIMSWNLKEILLYLYFKSHKYTEEINYYEFKKFLMNSLITVFNFGVKFTKIIIW